MVGQWESGEQQDRGDEEGAKFYETCMERNRSTLSHQIDLTEPFLSAQLDDCYQMFTELHEVKLKVEWR